MLSCSYLKTEYELLCVLQCTASRALDRLNSRSVASRVHQKQGDMLCATQNQLTGSKKQGQMPGNTQPNVVSCICRYSSCDLIRHGDRSMQPEHALAIRDIAIELSHFLLRTLLPRFFVLHSTQIRERGPRSHLMSPSHGRGICICMCIYAMCSI